MSPDLDRALRRFDGLPLAERLHVRARAFSCPLDAVAAHVPAGKVVELGCGHGLMSALLAENRERDVKGIDHDARKIGFAVQSSRPPNLSFSTGHIHDEPPASLDAVVIVDVLYLVPREDWAPLLQACVSRLKPGGKLVLKEAGTRPAWKHAKTWLQELGMARVLGRTVGKSIGFVPVEELAAEVRACGLWVHTADLSQGYTTPHALVVGVKAAAV